MNQKLVYRPIVLLCSALLNGVVLLGVDTSFEQKEGSMQRDFTNTGTNTGLYGQKPRPNVSKPHAKYRNIIFDLGGVLFNFNPKETLPLIFKDKSEVPWALLDSIKTYEWAEWDRGTMTMDQLCQALSTRFDCNDMRRFVLAVVEYLKPLSAGVEILKAVQARGYNTYVLSNLSEQAYRRIFFENDFFRTFQGAIFSYQVRMVKPELDIYRTLLKTYNLLPEECLFIDDLEVNINAGFSLGIDGVLCKNHEYVVQKLKELGIID